MQRASRGARLVRRYPILGAVPENERPAVVRTALRHPLLLIPVLLTALLLLPLYFELAFNFLGVNVAPQSIFDLGKIGCAVLLPVIIAVPLLSRFVLPWFLRREMKKRGYEPEL
ncbi:hypothetical protein LJC09_03250 [Desulfovibrio sp. OttesenSCG-928-F20]|nr:hypothetical protein [Desulfovibrio sp. OttesenSCG-928-F20]